MTGEGNWGGAEILPLTVNTDVIFWAFQLVMLGNIWVMIRKPVVIADNAVLSS